MIFLGAGSLLLEFGAISRLLGDPVYESLARRAVQSLWNFRNNKTGLFGDNMNIQSGQWISNMSGKIDLHNYFYTNFCLSIFLFLPRDEVLELFGDKYSYNQKKGTVNK